MALTDLKIKRTKPQLKDVWLTDEKGLRLLIKTNGAKYWRYRYRFGGKQKTLALGVYPDVTLKMARDQRDTARTQVSNGIDPSQVKKEQKHRNIMGDGNTFSILALEWFEHQKGTWSEPHAKKLWKRLKENSFEFLDCKPFDQIQPQDIILVTKAIEKRDALDVASRVLNDIRRVFSYAVRMGRLTVNPATELTGVIKTRKCQHRASMKNDELGLFLCELDEYGNRGRYLTQYALKMLVYTFVRSIELRGARWSEFDFGNAMWRIPAERMKMKTELLVPLSTQVLELLKQVQEISGQYDLLFPSERHREQPMSDNTMRRALQHRMGYDGNTDGKSKATPHGFRANASSLLNEQGFNPDAIERQLSHVERNGVRASYTHHARYMDERTKIMQWWAEHLDSRKKEVSINSNI